MNRNSQWHVLSYAAGFGGLNEGSDAAPLDFQRYCQQDLNLLKKIQWHSILNEMPNASFQDQTERLAALSHQHAKQVMKVVKEGAPFTVIGGDHTAAIGTWQGLSQIISPLGLIWIDAHMDSHTPQTTETGRLHGMPLACLLGEGDDRLTQLFSKKPTLKPEHVCLLGVRSFESGEAKLLHRLGVRIFYMDEIKRKGLMACLPEVLEIVGRGTQGFGISLDLDAIDPKEAPGVDVAEAGGISVVALMTFLREVILHPLWYGSEIVELNPQKDQHNKTQKIVKSILELFCDSRV